MRQEHMTTIHPTAILGKNIIFGDNVKIGPYTIIEDGVKIGNDTIISAHSVIKTGTIIENDCFIDNFVALGGRPQDATFDINIRSGVKIGHHTVIHEHATVHRATKPDKFTTVGSNCMLQTSSHVAHDCIVGDNTKLANCSMLGGKVKIGHDCFIGGGASIHQNVVVGDYVILGGYSAISLNLPSYVMSAGANTVIGLNLVGLRRAKFNNEYLVELKSCFREFYKRTGPTKERALKMIEDGYGANPMTQHFLKSFLAKTKLGFAPLRKKIPS